MRGKKSWLDFVSLRSISCFPLSARASGKMASVWDRFESDQHVAALGVTPLSKAQKSQDNSLLSIRGLQWPKWELVLLITSLVEKCLRTQKTAFFFFYSRRKMQTCYTSRATLCVVLSSQNLTWKALCSGTSCSYFNFIFLAVVLIQLLPKYQNVPHASSYSGSKVGYLRPHSQQHTSSFALLSLM